MARRAGIKVEEFGIGLPPRAKAIYTDKKGTVYSINWIPFGGYVKLYGEDASDSKALKAKNSFASKTKWQRSQVIVAGVVMNFILAWVLIAIGFSVGMKPFLITQDDVIKAQEAGLIEIMSVLNVHEITDGGPLSKVDILPGDLIVEINSYNVPKSENLSDILKSGQEVTLKILREGEESLVTVVPDSEGKLGFTVSDAPFVISQNDVKYSVPKAVVESAKEVGRLSYLTLDMLGNVITSLVIKATVPDGVAGPVGIARLTHQFTQQGIIALMQFAALLSISLGVINIMPFPALDGGRFLFIIFEAVLRKKPNAKMEAMVHGVGFILLMLLIVVITWNDIVNLFT